MFLLALYAEYFGELPHWIARTPIFFLYFVTYSVNAKHYSDIFEY